VPRQARAPPASPRSRDGPDASPGCRHRGSQRDTPFFLPVTPEAEDALRQAIRATGYEPRTADFGDWVWDVAFSPSSGKIAVGTRDHKATVWSLNTDGPDASARHEFRSGCANGVLPRHDARLLVSAGVAHVWDLARSEVAGIRTRQPDLRRGCHRADGQRLATAGQGVDGKSALSRSGIRSPRPISRCR
jgi:hypothetical protein